MHLASHRPRCMNPAASRELSLPRTSQLGGRSASTSSPSSSAELPTARVFTNRTGGGPRVAVLTSSTADTTLLAATPAWGQLRPTCVLRSNPSTAWRLGSTHLRTLCNPPAPPTHDYDVGYCGQI